MSLDVYVMPLHRFKSGDFRSPIEIATGIRPKIIVPGEYAPAKQGWFARLFRRGGNRPDVKQDEPEEVDHRRSVDEIRRAVEATNGIPISWTDEGDVIYSQQSGGMIALQAYAKWLDCRDRHSMFEAPPEGDYHRHPILSENVDHLSCPHLVGHDCYNGYFLPCDFEKLVDVEPYLIFNQFPATRSVGSSPRLIRELDFVQVTLQVPEDYEYPGEDPLFDVKAAYLQLRAVAELSCRHGLPIIFWG